MYHNHNHRAPRQPAGQRPVPRAMYHVPRAPPADTDHPVAGILLFLAVVAVLFVFLNGLGH